MKVIVSDSSPLIALLNIQHLDLLQLLFKEVIIPPSVANEIETGEKASSPWFTYKKSGFIRVEPLAKADNRQAILGLQLDAGESDAILLADQLKYPLLIDERAGRNLAKIMGKRLANHLSLHGKIFLYIFIAVIFLALQRS